MTGDVAVGVLGPVVVEVRGRARRINASRHRALLSLLVVWANERVTTDFIVEVLWGEDASTSSVGTLRGYVADLRQVLEPDREPHAPAEVLLTEPGGYLLRLPRHAVDAHRLETEVRRASARAHLLGDPWRPEVAAEDVAAAVEVAGTLNLALGLWRGRPLADLGEHPDVEAERERLHALRLEGQVLRAGLLVGLGRYARAVAELDLLCHAHPWHEQLWALRALALAGCGRQVEALASLSELRRSLADQLDIDPDPHVARLEAELVSRDALLPLAPAPRTGVRTPGLHRGASPRLVPRNTH